MAATVKSRNVLLGERAQAHARQLLADVDDFRSISVVGVDGASVAVPADLAEVLHSVLKAAADGTRISVERLPEELTTTVAADQLGVSRQALMKMIQRGELASRMVGTHHRLRADDVAELKAVRRARQRAAFAELRDLDDELDKY